jgi:SAM-dependent methyltransferase
LRIARQRLDSPAFAAALGEQLPFADATFDLVVLDQVIEHVNDQSRVLAEAFRVLKPGGAMYVACPNYLRFYEPHYKIWFFPLLPKLLGALYLRLRGRDPVLLNQLKYTTNWRVQRFLKRVKPERLVDLNADDVRRKFRIPGATFASRKARLVKQLTRYPWLSSAVLWAASFYIRLREGGCEMLAVKEA